MTVSLFKICSNCKSKKSLDEFLFSKRGKSQREGCCKVCRNFKSKIYRNFNKSRISNSGKLYYQQNKGSIREKHKQWYLNNKEAALDQSRSWYSVNKEAASRRGKVYYSKNKDLISQQHATYYSTPEGKLVQKAYVTRRRSRCGKLSTEVIQRVYEENIQKYRTLTCELCLKSITFGQDSLEHFHPISRKDSYCGDINERKNLGVAHRSCNSSKGEATLEEWRIR